MAQSSASRLFSSAGLQALPLLYLLFTPAVGTTGHTRRWGGMGLLGISLGLSPRICPTGDSGKNVPG